jgi:HlyD family secretion protein
MKKMSWKQGLTALLVLALVALLGWAFLPSPREVEMATVTQGRFERAVQEDGKTRLRDRYVITAPITGRVARSALKQGDTVTRHMTLALLWPSSPAMLDARSRAEQLAHSGAMQASLAKAQANRERAQAALEQARADLQRSESLALQGFISSTQNETGRLNLRLRDKELESARQEELAARYALEQTRATLGQFTNAPTEGAQAPFEIKAPVAGKVLKIHQQSEGLVMAGTPLMEIGDPSALEVVLDLLTEEAAQIKPGTLVQLSNWGGPEILEGQVRLVEPAAFTKISALGVEEQRVNAVVDLVSPAAHWKPLGDGFKLDVRVLVQTEAQAIKVPVSALFPQGSRSALFVVEGGKAHLREVDVVARNGVEAWIKAGLAPGTQVIVYPETELKDGDRVKPR